MVHYLDPGKIYTSRNYLRRWISESFLVVTDEDFQDLDQAQERLHNHPVQRRVFDITHNPYPDEYLPDSFTPLLTTNFQRWYQPKPGHFFFPLFVWMFSLKDSIFWQPLKFDAGCNKTKPIMCLNYTPRAHRTQLWEELNRRGVIDRMVYSFNDPGPWATGTFEYPLRLPDDTTVHTEASMGVEHSVYELCAVNIVTETSATRPFLNEKTCKPFVARQIPIFVGAPYVNQFLQDIGLDMFSDVVPWHYWDSEPSECVRVNRIAEFVEGWIRSDQILSDYQSLLGRIEKNKLYFHSQEFRDTIMCQMKDFKL